jgi:hypothetical protein
MMYMETSRTITETVMLALIRTSSKKAGIGAIIANTIPNTANGTASSDRFPIRDAAGLLTLPAAGFLTVVGRGKDGAAKAPAVAEGMALMFGADAISGLLKQFADQRGILGTRIVPV